MNPMIKKILHAGVPVPGVIRPIIRGLYRGGVLVAEMLRWLYGSLVVAPVVKSIAEGADSLRVERIPYIRGRGRIVLGSHVYVSGKVGIAFSRHVSSVPEFRVGDRTFIGHMCAFGVAEAITIGNDCLIGSGVRIQDNDGHSLDSSLRRAGHPVDAAGIKRVTIDDNVWIAPGSTILKGVKIGRNSVVGACSVVTKDVPPDSLVAGNPAKVIRTIAN